jgi:hypothetical protein
MLCRFGRFTFAMCALLVAAAPASQAATEKPYPSELAGFERRFFMHDNANLSPAERLNRLEQFVFGSLPAGDVNQRADRLRSLLAAQEKGIVTESVRAVEKPAPPETVEIKRMEQLEPPRCNGVKWVTKAQLGLIDQMEGLERELFARKFDDDTMSKRIERLENEIYPNILISSAEDFATRVGRLMDRVSDLRDDNALPTQKQRVADRPVMEKVSGERNSGEGNDGLEPVARSETRTAFNGADILASANRTTPSDSTTNTHPFRKAFFTTLKGLAIGAAMTLGTY